MIRQNYTIREDQITFLKSLAGNASEHVRAAIDDYKLKKEREAVRVSLSPSKKGAN